MVDMLNLGPQRDVEIGQIGNTALIELTQELVTKRAVPVPQLALTFKPRPCGAHFLFPGRSVQRRSWQSLAAALQSLVPS
jgi:hypothetical protein